MMMMMIQCHSNTINDYIVLLPSATLICAVFKCCRGVSECVFSFLASETLKWPGLGQASA